MKYFALSLFACAAVMAGQENTEVVAEVAPAVCTEDSLRHTVCTCVWIEAG